MIIIITSKIGGIDELEIKHSDQVVISNNTITIVKPSMWGEHHEDGELYDLKPGDTVTIKIP